MPAFGLVDLFIKKGGHAFGYGVLALSYCYAMYLKGKHGWLAFMAAILNALSGEFHQSFVPGRKPSLIDALVIDTASAAFTLLPVTWFRRKTLKVTNKDMAA